MTSSWRGCEVAEATPLPTGVTGFYTPGGPGVELSTFAAWGHAAARAIGATLSGLAASHVTPNFHSLTLSSLPGWDPAWMVVVVCNDRHPIVAFCASRWLGGHGEFLPAEALPAGLRETWESFGPPLEIWTQERLLTPLSPALTEQLHPDELRQFTYWKPWTVGDVVFNYWD